MQALLPSIYLECAARVQSYRHRHLALKVEFGEVEHLLPHHPLLPHAPHAVQAESDCVAADGLWLHAAELEGLCKDGAGAFLDPRLGPLLFSGQQDQMYLPRHVPRAPEGWDVRRCRHGYRQPLLSWVVVKGHIQGAIFGEGFWLVAFGEKHMSWHILGGWEGERKTDRVFWDCSKNTCRFATQKINFNIMTFLKSTSVGRTNILAVKQPLKHWYN